MEIKVTGRRVNCFRKRLIATIINKLLISAAAKVDELKGRANDEEIIAGCRRKVMKLSAWRRVGGVNFLLVAVTWEMKILGGQRKEKRESEEKREKLVSSNEMKKRKKKKTRQQRFCVLTIIVLRKLEKNVKVWQKKKRKTKQGVDKSVTEDGVLKSDNIIEVLNYLTQLRSFLPYSLNPREERFLEKGERREKENGKQFARNYSVVVNSIT